MPNPIGKTSRPILKLAGSGFLFVACVLMGLATIALAHSGKTGEAMQTSLFILGICGIVAAITGAVLTGVAIIFYPMRIRGRTASISDTPDHRHLGDDIDALGITLARQTRQLRNLNRELESFTHSVSHDLRAPLRAISGYAMIIEEDYGDVLGDKGQELLQVVRKNIGRMDALITDLLTLSKVVSADMSPETIAMQKLVGDIVVSMQHQHGNVEFIVDSLEDIVADKTLIRQVWESLLSNAVKFSSKTAHPVIRISSAIGQDEVIFTVQDNGSGFETQYGHKLFGVFQRLHRQEDFPGAGIGLALVQRIVARHDGRVGAQGSPGEGAAFWFALPRAAS